MSKRTFILNDETVVNSHGFKISNAGIRLERFRLNPVMLSFHDSYSPDSVIGKWENIRVEGSQLLADAVFDEEDEMAKKIARKVDKGFLSGVSMGVSFNGEFMQKQPDGTWVMTSCELFEASIVAIPSNSSAVKLYTETHELMNESQIRLFMESKQVNPINMSKITLSVATLLALGLQNADDTSQLSAAIDKLVADYESEKVKLSAMTKERDTLQEKLSAIDNAKIEALVEDAVKSGKITADKKAHFLLLAKTDLATCEGILSAIPAKKDLHGTGSNAQNFDTVKTPDDFEKLSVEQKLAFKADFPDKYKELFNPKNQVIC